MRGIEAAGVYLPRYRLDAAELRAAWGRSDATGIDEKSVPAADEDAATMAAAAAESALSRSTVERTEVTHLGFATTTPPLDEEMIAPRVSRGLGLPDTVETAESTQSTLAGADVLRGGLAVDGPALVVIADAPLGDPADADHPLGAGAAAFVLTDAPAVTVLDRATHTDELPGVRFRERGAQTVESLDSTSYERAAIRESVASAVDRLDVSVDGVTGAALPQDDGRLPSRVGGSLPVDSDAIARGTVVDQMGDVGAAAVPLGLLAALEAGEVGDRTLAAFFGSGGGAAAFAFEGSVASGFADQVEYGTAVTYAEYLRERGHLGRGAVAGGGAHVSLPTWLGTLDQRYRLVAGRCLACEELSFPPEGACRRCHERAGFEDVELPREGTVEARTVIGQGGAPPEFAEQQRRDGPYAVALVRLALDDGAVTVPAQLADVDPSSVESGDSVRAVLRRIHEAEGVPRYGVKFVPTGRPL